MSSFLAVLLFALVHLFAEKIGYFGRLLSLGSGVSIAYVFVDLLPKICKGEIALQAAGFFPYIEKHVFVMALMGFLTFFVVGRTHHSERGVWFSLVSYAIFNFLVGYAVADKNDPDVQPLLLFSIAMALHYFTNDYTWVKQHPALYQKSGRVILITFLFLGWLLGQWLELPPSPVALVAAFIGGGVIMNVIRHELPSDNPNSLPVFLLSAAGYTVLLLGIG